MAWNEPGNDDKDDKKDKQNNDPWSGRKKNEQGPPDLDEAFKKLQQKIGSLFGAKKGGGSKLPGGSAGGSSGGEQTSFKAGGTIGVVIVLVIILALWAVSGFFTVQAPEKAVILRFGKYLKTLNPGLHWIPRFVDSKYIVNVSKIYSYSYDAQMLTKDENIVSVSIAVQYRLANPRNYLFNVVNPIESLRQATASALRQVVGITTLDNILTVGREQVRQETRAQLEKILKRYHTGLVVTDVALQPAKAPEEVKAAFDDAIKAQEDEQTYVNQAQAYTMKVEPIAKGQAKRILESANAYKQQVVLRAEGNTAKYLALLPEYIKAPKVTRERMYLDAMQNVFQESTKVLIDTKGNNNLLYLPLDKLLGPNLAQLSKPAQAASSMIATTPTSTSSATPSIDTGAYGSGGAY